jgi:hypothetical protein
MAAIPVLETVPVKRCAGSHQHNGPFNRNAAECWLAIQGSAQRSRGWCLGWDTPYLADPGVALAISIREALNVLTYHGSSFR